MFSSFVVIVIVIVLSVVDVILAADVAKFTPIKLDFDDSEIYHVVIDLSRNGYGGSGPNTTMFTLFPSNEGDGITVETSPKNLVTIPQWVKDWNTPRTLEFLWNTDVSSTATSGGVRIGIPSHQLEKIEVKGGHTAQVLDGFTNIRNLSVGDDGSIIRASMLSLVSDTLGLSNNGGRMYVETNIPVSGDSYFTNGGQTWIETPSINSLRVEHDGSQVNIKGDLRDGKVLNGGQLTVTGSITGTIMNHDYSTVNAPSCDNVFSNNGSTCNAGPWIVDVDVGDLSQNDFGGAVSASFSVLPGYFATTAVVVVVTVVATTATLI